MDHDRIAATLPAAAAYDRQVATRATRPWARMRLMTPQQATFADYFAHWGLTMPDEAVARRGDGHLNGAGWSVRFVWRDDGTLLFRAGHRMTNERVHAISPDGVLTWAEPAAPGEFMVIPEGSQPRGRSPHRARLSAGVAGVLRGHRCRRPRLRPRLATDRTACRSWCADVAAGRRRVAVGSLASLTGSRASSSREDRVCVAGAENRLVVDPSPW